VLQCDTVCCSVLQCDTVCCSVSALEIVDILEVDACMFVIAYLVGVDVVGRARIALNGGCQLVVKYMNMYKYMYIYTNVYIYIIIVYIYEYVYVYCMYI